MRIALSIVLLLSVFTFAYSFFGETSVVARWSNVRGILADAAQAIPKGSLDRIDELVLSLRGEWEAVKVLSLLTSIAALIALILVSKSRTRHESEGAA